MMEKVLHVLPSFFSLDSRVINQTSCLSRYYNLTTISYAETHLFLGGKDLSLKNIKVNYRKLFGLLIFIVKCRKFILNEDVKIVHCHDFQGLLIGGILKFMLPKGIIFIYDAHELWSEAHYEKNFKNLLFRRIGVLIERKFAFYLGNVITVSNSIKFYLESYFDIKEIQVIRNIPSYVSKKESTYLRDFFGINEDKKIILYQGLISEARGVFDLVNDFMNTLVFEKYALVFLGDGPSMDLLKKYVDSINVENIYFHKKVKAHELSAITSSADIGIHPLRKSCLNHEYALPNKLFEYLNCGLIVIAADLFEMRREISLSKIGYVFKGSEELKDILIDLQSYNKFKSLKENVKVYAEKNNYEDEMIKLHLFYQKLLGR